ncbi:hypothetical protein [Hymenobacter cellulosilyticus]|uniref:DNA methylase adenine-specific domain-containing protein n=1 Tax=Hymenobacter cellulosilyticus TaxID=2932248 RepID=A0A8T9QD47_9BACT|nr:hypothetical protein [Hymenobacter cellulosilyticus]UOQ75155.1 hypothetical protein MUN79_28620 [Hymenobacter cellulosilyticus]
MKNQYDVVVGQKWLAEGIKLISQGSKEDVIRHQFAAYLPQLFPEKPWWVEQHALGAESYVKFRKAGKNTGGFVDTLVGLTAIEYEKDLNKGDLFTHGLEQVKDYCAGLLNDGHPQELIIGILSDTVRWHAYRIASVTSPDVVEKKACGAEHVVLEEIQALVLTDSDERSSRQLGEFLIRHLGREGARPLSAHTLAHDLGFESDFCKRHVNGIEKLVDLAFAADANYAGLITKLWNDFVAYLGDNSAAGGFEKDVYVRELYLLTLAKLLCANIIAKKALVSNDDDIRAILNGDHFKNQGLTNLVEYDYFGWLNSDPHVSALIPVAMAIQDDLRAYDFKSAPAEDLFGATMAQLAKRSQRLLLGQEWTPAWLAAKLVERVFAALPAGEAPKLIDMCCGSGAMVVEAVKLAKARLDASGVPVDAAYVSELAHSITGFDIDPLAVMLSKVSWVVAARDRLEPFGSSQVVIPIYHADSLFTATPLSKNVDKESGTNQYALNLDDKKVGLPSFLVSPEARALFDAILNGSYEMAMVSARAPSPMFTPAELAALLAISERSSGIELNTKNKAAALKFCGELVSILDGLQRSGRNGIWAFILRNSYRPGLVAGLFNGLISNPPWLALSKIADNPYKKALRSRADRYGIKPQGPSHLHIELATIFLLHAVERYLKDGAAIGCILPETVLSGDHHEPFRTGAFLTSAKPVQMGLDEVWRIERGTFKNEAIIFFGKKEARSSFVTGPIPGNQVAPHGLTPIQFNQITQGNRVAWSDRVPVSSSSPASSSVSSLPTVYYRPAIFRQGADIMPRTLIFHEATPVNNQWALGPIDRNSSSNRYLVNGAKLHKAFSLPSSMVPGQYVFDVLMSNHLTAFDIVEPAKGLLPIVRNRAGNWEPETPTMLATQGAARQAFGRIFAAVGPTTTSTEFFKKLDTNLRKLSTQLIPSSGWLVIMGAGGDLPCAAYTDITVFDTTKLIIDQTLYWSVVSSEDEAVYLTGLLNSEALNGIIKDFQARGQWGSRHVHTLPIGVTPQYDATNAVHTEVVNKTRVLLQQWKNLKATDATIAQLLDPNQRLPQRRSSLRVKITALPSYSSYAFACRSLYGV